MAQSKSAPPLRGRRPRRAGTWGFRAMQLVTQSLAPVVISFLRRNVVRQKGAYLRQIKQRGMAGTPATVTFVGAIHPAVRRGKRVGMRCIQPGRPEV